MNKQKVWIIGITVLIIGCCSLYLGREFAIAMDREACDQQLSKKFDISPAPGKIRGAIYSRLNTILEPGMSHAEVIARLPEIAPATIEWKESRSDGGYNEYVILETCQFHRNGYSFLFLYSEDHRFQDVINYFDD